jgi:hypothetical protein
MAGCKCPVCAGRRRFFHFAGDVSLGGFTIRPNVDRVALVVSAEDTPILTALNTYIDGNVYVAFGDQLSAQKAVVNFSNSPYIFDIERWGQLIMGSFTFIQNNCLSAAVWEVILREEHDDLGSYTHLRGK